MRQILVDQARKKNSKKHGGDYRRIQIEIDSINLSQGDVNFLARAETIFNEASNLPPRQRAAFLEKECVGDAELLALVSRLLSRDSQGMGCFGESARRWGCLRGSK